MKSKPKNKKNKRAVIAVVVRSFFAIVPKDIDENQMSIMLLAKTKKLARRLYEVWNDEEIQATAAFLKAEGTTYRKFKIIRTGKK